MRCEHCGTTGEEDGIGFDGYQWLCDYCYEEKKEVFREKYLAEKGK